ncbi:MAG: autotransporter outer membrane beta-barrel domain-containing protein [Gammaproteobacteria bacterium]
MKKRNPIGNITPVRRKTAIATLFIALAPFAQADADDGIASGTLTSPSGSSGQQASFQAMADICDSSEADASFACSLTGGGIFSSAATGNSLQLQQLSPQSAMQSESIAITSPYQFIRTVNRQAQKMRECENDKGSGKHGSECGGTGGGSGADAYGFIGPFGISISGGGGFGDRENSVGQTGFKIDTRQANLIIDYPFTREFIGGFSFGYLSTDRSLGLDSGSLDSDSYRFAPFFSFTPTPESYLTLMGGYSRVDFDSTRKVSPVVNQNIFNDSITIPFSDATARYNADQFFASLGGGYTHRMGDWSLRGYGRADYSHTSVSSFQESGGVAGGFAYANEIDGQSVLSTTSTLGAELSYAISTTVLPAVVIPRLYAEWVHEFKNNGRQLQTAFNADSDDNSFSSVQSIAVAGPERNWGNLGFGVQMLFPHAVVAYVNYETLFIENASNQTVLGGIRVNF